MAENMKFLSSATLDHDDLEGDMQTSGKNKNTTKPTQQKQKQEASINIDQMTPINNNDDQGMISTLDEPVSVTIKRDLKAIGLKFAHVFYPKQSSALLKDWDMWGPLLLTVLLAISLQGDNNASKSAPEFANVFAMIALGAIVVTINTKLLSGKISFFQSICVLGYCLLPLVAVSVLNSYLLLPMFSKMSNSLVVFSIRCSLIFIAFAWSVFASTAFLEGNTINLNDRKLLALYPIFLFYFVISWFIILHIN